MSRKLGVDKRGQMWYTDYVTIQFESPRGFLFSPSKRESNKAKAQLYILGKRVPVSASVLGAPRLRLDGDTLTGTSLFSPNGVCQMSKLSPGERLRRDEMFRQGMLWCCRCNQYHPVKDFRKLSAPRTNYGYRRYCCRCESEQRDGRTQYYKSFFKNRNSALKAKFVEMAGGKCQRCGYDEFYPGLDFHHVYPAEKKYHPAYIINSGDFEKAWREMDKCCLLCQTCHTAYEAELWRAEFIKRDGLGWTVGNQLPLDDRRYTASRPPKYKQTPLPLFAPKKSEAQLKLFEAGGLR